MEKHNFFSVLSVLFWTLLLSLLLLLLLEQYLYTSIHPWVKHGNCKLNAWERICSTHWYISKWAILEMCSHAGWDGSQTGGSSAKSASLCCLLSSLSPQRSSSKRVAKIRKYLFYCVKYKRHYELNARINRCKDLTPQCAWLDDSFPGATHLSTIQPVS